MKNFIKEQLESSNADDRLWAMAYLKELGKLGKRLYIICAEGEIREKLKENLFKLKDKLEKI